MRLFIAAQLSDDMKKAITGTMHDLKKQGIRGDYAPAANLHMTFAFLGEVEDPAAVKEAMKAIKWKPFRLALSSFGTFGDLLYVGVKGSQGLSGTAAAVRTALDDAGISYDKQKFLGHITMIRHMNGRYQSVTPPKADMMVKKLSLMKSVSKDGKVVYTEIFSV